MMSTRLARLPCLVVLSAALALAGLAGCRTERTPRPERGVAGAAESRVAALPTLDAPAFPAPPPAAAVPPDEGLAERPAGGRADVAATPLRIRRLVVASGVRDREPEGAAEAFRVSETERLYAFVEVANPGARPDKIIVTFEPEQGPAVGHVELEVGASKRFRTWAYTRGATKAGAWTAVVRDEAGAVLARAPFRIEA